MQDKRLTNRLTEYWNKLRKDALLPQWEHFNSSSFEDLWKQCCGWRVERGQGDTFIYTYDHVGSSVKEALGNVDPTGQMFTRHFRNFPGAQVVQKIDMVVKDPQPRIDEGQFVNDENKVIKYRSCLLPFGTADGLVTHVVMGLSWRAF